MNDDNQQQTNDKLSMTLSVFIALCVVSIFCAISIAIVENIDSMSRDHKAKRVNLQHIKDTLQI